MSVRVIAGSAKGRRLKMVPGDSTRPVTDRVKEACFSIIGRDIIAARFLDLFGGSGSVGIEALSRGAHFALFVERDRFAVQTIAANLELTRLGDKAAIRRADVFSFLKHPPAEPYDFIYIAPPQYKGLWLQTLEIIDANPAWLNIDSTVIVQIDPSEDQPADLQHLTLSDQRTYGKTRLNFYQPTP